ncbi:hypothetical protein PAMA_017661 [Pampus argenteus]
MKIKKVKIRGAPAVRVLICVASSCIVQALLFVYVAAMLCLSMHSTTTKTTKVVDTNHFVASGTLNKKDFTPLPKTFWAFHLHKNVFWNQLQQEIDRNFNPILHSKNIKRRFESQNFDNFLLRQSSSKVRRNLNMTRNFYKLPQQIRDFVGHMDRRDYPILLQPGAVCGAGAKDEKEPPLLLLAIKTTAMNFKNRQAIRKTWGEKGWVGGQWRNSTRRETDGGYVRRVFLLGKENPPHTSVDVSDLLQWENEHYGDMLQWDFSDTFFNLTLKDVLFWSWFSRYCNQTRFVLKGDDDVFINTPRMISFLQDQLRKPQADKAMNDFMVGNVIGAALPNRANASKYFIPESFYQGLYPAYAGGGGVVYSGVLAQRLHNISKRIHLFPIDDVYVGMCMIRLQTSPIHHPAFRTFDFPDKDGEEPCAYHTILLVHKRSPQQLVKLWADMKRKQKQCWNVSLREDETKGKGQKT